MSSRPEMNLKFQLASAFRAAARLRISADLYDGLLGSFHDKWKLELRNSAIGKRVLLGSMQAMLNFRGLFPSLHRGQT